VRAAVAGLALRIAGYENTMVYEGSMHEWSRSPHLELVTTDERQITAAGTNTIDDDCED